MRSVIPDGWKGRAPTPCLAWFSVTIAQFLPHSDAQDFTNCFPSEACGPTTDGTVACSRGYTGVDCMDCSDTWYRFGLHCQECPSWGIDVSLLITFLMLVFFVLLPPVLAFWRVHASTTPVWLLLMFVQVLALFRAFDNTWLAPLPRLFRAASFTHFDVRVAASTACGSEGGAVTLIEAAATPVEAAIQSLGQTDETSITTSEKDAFAALTIQFLLPLVSTLLYIIVASLKSTVTFAAYSPQRESTVIGEVVPCRWTHGLWLGAHSIFLSFLPISQALVMSVGGCTQVGDVQRLDVIPTTICQWNPPDAAEPKWQGLLLSLLIPFCLVYLVIFGLVVGNWSLRRRIVAHTHSLPPRLQPSLAASPLLGELKNAGNILVLHGLMVTLSLCKLFSSRLAEAIALASVLSASGLLIGRAQPFCRQRHNRLAVGTLTVLAVTAFLGFITVLNYDQYAASLASGDSVEREAQYLGLITFCLCLGWILVLVAATLQELHVGRRTSKGLTAVSPLSGVPLAFKTITADARDGKEPTSKGEEAQLASPLPKVAFSKHAAQRASPPPREELRQMESEVAHTFGAVKATVKNLSAQLQALDVEDDPIYFSRQISPVKPLNVTPPTVQVNPSPGTVLNPGDQRIDGSVRIGQPLSDDVALPVLSYVKGKVGGMIHRLENQHIPERPSPFPDRLSVLASSDPAVAQDLLGISTEGDNIPGGMSAGEGEWAWNLPSDERRSKLVSRTFDDSFVPPSFTRIRTLAVERHPGYTSDGPRLVRVTKRVDPSYKGPSTSQRL